MQSPSLAAPSAPFRRKATRHSWLRALFVLVPASRLRRAGPGRRRHQRPLRSRNGKALRDGRAGDAIASFEALADRGVVDPVASYDRGLAYATRVRIAAEVPGRPGARGARLRGGVARPPLATPSSPTTLRARLSIVRSEVARRRTRAGQPVEVDPGRSLGRTVAGLLAEDTWAGLAAVASALLSLGLFCTSWLARVPRVRVACGLAAGVAAPLLAVSVGDDFGRAVTIASLCGRPSWSPRRARPDRRAGHRAAGRGRRSRGGTRRDRGKRAATRAACASARPRPRWRRPPS